MESTQPSGEPKSFYRPDGTVDRWSGNVIRATDNGLHGDDSYGSMDPYSVPNHKKKFSLRGWLHGDR